jgi:tetratricopeptide (TPR) repeat protein
VEGEAKAEAKAEAEEKPASPIPKTKAAAAVEAASTASEGEGATADGGDRMDLPKWNRAKVKRKKVAGEQEDDAAIRRAPLAFGLIVVVAAVIAGVFWYRGHSAEKDAEATRILAGAAGIQARGEVTPPGFENDRKLPFPVPLLAAETERAAQVEKGLAELQSAAEGSEADRLAELMRGAQQVKDGKFGDAIATYSAFLDKNPQHELGFLAHEGKAIALEANGDIEGALAELDRLAGNKGDFYRDQALAQKGRMLEAAGRKDEAIAVYETYVEEYPLDKDSIAKPEIIERLRELKPELVPADADRAGAGDFALPPGLMP